MRKVLFIFGLFFLIGLLFPKDILAGCTRPSLTRGCSSTETGCLNSGTLYCCDSPASCSQLQAGQTTGGLNGWNKISPTQGCGETSINTAIGCIPVLNSDNGTQFAGFLLKWGIGVGGGIAFLLIVYASFMIMTSQGDPNRLKAGQELLTSAISGIILLIFSIFILKFIGIDILGLGNFGFGK